MKKNLSLLVLLSLLIGGNGFSQGISGGIKAGVNISNQNITDESTSSLVGYHGGFYLTLMLSKHIGLQPEILYSLQGSKISSGTISATQKISYVTVPILLRYNLNQLISLHAGPQLGLVTAAKYVNGSSTVDMKDSIKSTDFGLAAGAGVDLPFGLSVTVRYIFGLTDIGKVLETKTNNFQASVGYKLFGKR